MSGIMKSLRGGADRAAFEAAKLVRLQREQFRLKTQEDQKRELMQNLGEAVWQLHGAGKVSEPQLLAICQQLQGVVKQIHEIGATIEKIRQEQPPEPSKCEACGRELTENDLFCPACGGKVVNAQAAQPGPVAATQTCPNCGGALRPGAAFCGACGHRLTPT